MNKKIIAIILGIIIASGGSFYAGMEYGQSKSSATVRGVGGGFTNLSPAERQARLQQLGTSGAIGQRGTGAAGGFATGEILSKDDRSITIKFSDGGSKIIFYSDSTEIGKFVSGTQSDLEIGKIVIANGQANQDGSITAQSIQMRPEGLTSPPR